MEIGLVESRDLYGTVLESQQNHEITPPYSGNTVSTQPESTLERFEAHNTTDPGVDMFLMIVAGPFFGFERPR